MEFPCSENLVRKGCGSHQPNAPSKTLSGDTSPDLGSQPPKNVSDPVTVSTDCSGVSDSSDVDEDIFDTPARPVSNTCTYDFFAPGTPLTPPETPSNNIDTSPPCVAPPEKNETIFTASATRNPAVGTEANGAIKEQTDNSGKGGVDSSRPKLFRNLTDLLEPIKNADASKAWSSKSTPPNFEFSKTGRPAAKKANVTKHPGTRTEASSKPRLPSVSPSNTLKTDCGDGAERAASSWFAHLGLLTKFGKELEFIIPYNVSERLSEAREKCISTPPTKAKDSGIITRCHNKAKGHDSPIEPLRALEDAYSRKDYVTLFDCIIKVATNAMCGVHFKSVTQSEKRMGQLRKTVTALPNAPTDKVKDFHIWLKKLSSSGNDISTSNIEVNNDERYCDRSKSTLRSTDSAVSSGKTSASFPHGSSVFPSATNDRFGPDQPKPKKDVPAPAAARPAVAKSLIFKPYQPKCWKNVTTPAAIRSTLEKPLTPRELKSGFIYMFWYAGHFGHIKIGRSKDIQTRLEGWNNQCKRNHEFHKPSYDGELDKVPHVNRVETLIHRELKDCRKFLKCEEGCGRKHIEWFEVEERHAVAVFMKWKKWIETRPYELRADGKWVLSDSARKSLDKLCEPVDRTDEVPSKVKQRQSRQTSGSKIRR